MDSSRDDQMESHDDRMDSRVEATVGRLRASYPAYDWIPVTHGHSGALTYRLDARQPLYAKFAAMPAHPDPRSAPRAEADRIAWLASTGIPGPELVDAGETDGVEWLVMTVVPGRVASNLWPADQRMRVMDAVADQLQDLHALSVSACPFDRTLDVTLRTVRQALAEGLTDHMTEAVAEWKQDLDQPGLLAGLEADRPTEEVVVGHGDYCLPNVLIDPDTLRPTGLIDLGRLGRTDRYADFGLMSRSIGSPTMNPQYDQSHVVRFLARLGVDPDDPRLEYYQRLDLLF